MDQRRSFEINFKVFLTKQRREIKLINQNV